MRDGRRITKARAMNAKSVLSCTHQLPLHLSVGAEPVLEVGEPPLQLVLLLVAVPLPEVQVGPPVRRVEAPVTSPVLRDVRVADELVRAEEALTLEALDAPRLGVDGRLGQQDAQALAEALVLHLEEEKETQFITNSKHSVHVDATSYLNL